MPGQWDDGSWGDAVDVAGLDYNVHRWYETGTGRYSRPDPMGIYAGSNVFAYSFANPLFYADPLGLATFICRRPLGETNPQPGETGFPNPAHHTYVCVVNGDSATCGGQTTTGGGLFGKLFSPGRPTTPDEGDIFDKSRCDEQVGDEECVDRCVLRRMGEPRPFYGAIGPGTNCQEWAGETLTKCLAKCTVENLGLSGSPPPNGEDLNEF